MGEVRRRLPASGCREESTKKRKHEKRDENTKERACLCSI